MGRPRGSPEEVRVHDFIIPELGRAAPYGVYPGNVGWVGIDQRLMPSEASCATYIACYRTSGESTRFEITQYTQHNPHLYSTN
jgi:hypothetical protein